MAKRLAIEWDARELRVVAGLVRGDRVTITDVATIAIDSSEPQALGETLKRLLAQSGLEKLSGGVALGRGKAELRELKLPPVPEGELPDMVRFQAIRSFATAGDKSAIDFIPTRRDADGIRVVAASVTPEELKKCALVAVPSQMSVDRLVLRPLAAAALFRSRNKAQDGETVLIDLLADDADIVVIREGVPVFVRSIRLPEEISVRVRTLSGEIRRSVMASQDSGTDTNCQRRIILWGRADVHHEEVKGLSESLNTEVETLDPFSLVDVDVRLRSSLPEHVGRLAPLIGLLDCDARADKDLIDFLNPRRPPAPPSPMGRNLVIGAAAAALVGTLFFLGWKRISDLDADIAAQQSAYDALDSAVEVAEDSMARTEKVEAFLDGDVFWLNEFRRVATEMPASEYAIIESVAAESGRFGGGVLTIAGGATSSDTVSELESKLRDENHIVSGKGISVVADKAPYKYTYTAGIAMTPEVVREERVASEEAVLRAAVEAPTEPAASPEVSESAEVSETPIDVVDGSPSDVATESNSSGSGDAQETKVEEDAPGEASSEGAAAETAEGETDAEPAPPTPDEPESGTPQPAESDVITASLDTNKSGSVNSGSVNSGESR